jgi:hypothetical protein
MRYHANDHDPRMLDLIAVLVLVGVVIAASVFMNRDAYTPTTLAGVYPTHTVNW